MARAPQALNVGEAQREVTSQGLRQAPKQLPTVWLYDERGSRLCAEISGLPEYYLTRRENEILRDRAGEIAARTRARTLVELGSGTAQNTRLLLGALGSAGTLERFVALDVSEQTLRASAAAIENEYESLAVDPIVGDFERLPVLPAGRPRLIAFLGSTIGNLDPGRRRRFFAAVAGGLEPGDALLLGMDLVKDVARLEAAYNDARGLTEIFLRNALTAVDRELGATFDQDLFVYDARWDAEHERMDIGFRARRAHTVSVPGLGLEVEFEAGEKLRVEISAKFRRGRVEEELRDAGLALAAWWTDAAGDFAVALALPDAAS
jgi:L-histidine Nalpha-methyltransferase